MRRLLARGRRTLRDWWRGRLGPWVVRRHGGAAAPLHEIASYACPTVKLSFQQHVFENKMHNLALVQSRLDGVTIRPGELFSFWRLVGPADGAHGFKVASNFIGGRLDFAEGGGICQLSSALYNAALLAGLDILERHAHSIDAYGDNRYVPLGLDATVAYGYKDLQFRNGTTEPMKLRIRISADEVAAAFDAPEPPFADVDVVVEALSIRHTRTRRRRDGSWDVISEDRYALPASAVPSGGVER